MAELPNIPPEFRVVDSSSNSFTCSEAGNTQLNLPSMDQPFLTGFVPTAVGKVPRVLSHLSWADRVGGYKARWGVGRMKYTIEPGLYALGNPGRESPVLVTANYKMSFDRLRQSLPGRSLWILVLDTEGINVWCAAGKGTFGTQGLVRRIAGSRLTEVVSHRELVLPQLAGPGVAAHLVKRFSGFKVVYGPIRAEDLSLFLDAGMKATPEMRIKTFSLMERAVLIPIELVHVLKALVILFPVLFIMSGLLGRGEFLATAMAHLIFVPALLAAVLAGAVLTPLLLPWLPGRAFSMKGLPLGLACAAFLILLQAGHMGATGPLIETAAWMILAPAMTTYLAMNFTGASTYTSLSGVRKEMGRAVPIQAGAAVIGLGLWIYSLLAL